MISKRAERPVYLVDVNLPRRFSFFNTSEFVHVIEIDATLKDREIWNYAIDHKLTILTKDTDFYEMYLTQPQHPKIVHFKIGNFTINTLHQYFTANWDFIKKLLETNEFIMAFKDNIKAIN
ncbi:DUF5615 family PIN-like protein [Alkalitalea saponilacus]|uniref:Predicted nuclease, contains PIN domain, potential toxin-antitoxin system component n=1 Tax=Alkalitalea saponilacus TaxID=889453 RepID=A0A1T5H0M8_9BACT|nr:DUF5615 family PIN-like protein [Alkalitalea saponilacus]ASB50945.1 hypothetical protein CDL62_18235 [Alkalitalea saponilacus]SKC14224.1 Predicted nuclease, contains PIN domain, potential toxin-antitoxin system component [Alkalitalea saponilacus]